MAGSLPQGLKEPVHEAPPSSNQIKTEIKQEQNGTVTVKKRGEAEGNERRSEKPKTEESAKVGLPSKTAYQFMYDFLQCFETFKTDNKFIKEFMHSLLDTTITRKDYLEKKILSMEVAHYVMDVAFNESIQKAQDSELDDDLVIMETEQIRENKVPVEQQTARFLNNLFIISLYV